MINSTNNTHNCEARAEQFYRTQIVKNPEGYMKSVSEIMSAFQAFKNEIKASCPNDLPLAFTACERVIKARIGWEQHTWNWETQDNHEALKQLADERKIAKL